MTTYRYTIERTLRINVDIEADDEETADTLLASAAKKEDIKNQFREQLEKGSPIPDEILLVHERDDNSWKCIYAV